ncbi:MAG: hypothetical protein U0522_01525 [Candidatus Paceibacterota bacterium]
MGPNKVESKIDRRERDLYSRNVPQEKEPVRGGFTKPNYDVSNDWQNKDSFASALTQEITDTEKKSKFFKFFFIGSVGFFVVAVSFFIYMSYGGFNAVSSKNLDINIQAPVSIGGGEELVLDIVVTNNNNVPLESAQLLVEYPEGTREVLDLSKDLLRQTETLGPIASGESVTKTVKAVLFGEKNTSKDIKVSVEYKAQGSNATFTKEKDYPIVIQSSPVIFTVDYAKEVNSNQKMDLTISVTSNSNTIIENLLVRADYPFGFSLDSATPQASFDNNVWSIGDLKPKEKRVIKISGKIEGQNDEEKTFRFSAGTATSEDEKLIGVDFISSAETVMIRKPFFDVKLALENDESKEYLAEIGQSIKANISWTNNLPVSVNDAVLEVTLGGSALDRNKVSTDQRGFYQSSANKITWNKNTAPSLSEINPGESGSFNFDFSTLSNSAQNIFALRNPEINLDITIKGVRFSDSEPPQEISYSFSRKVKVITQATFGARMVYSTGPFENRGPIPPKAEKETTYTVIWTLSNAFNDLTNTSVSASLPPYVKWENVKSPLSDKILYNPTTNKVVWEPGEIKAGVGYSSSPREVAFQVSFLPSLGQVGFVPKIIEDVTFTGQDRFTLKNISITNAPLTTRISTDPAFDFTDDVVVK